MAQETMGEIYDRTQEHLGTSDNMVIRTRRRLINSAKAYREFPWSRTTRLVTNVRILDLPDVAEDEIAVAANFAAYRYRKGDEQVLVGSYEYRLVEEEGDFRIRLKRIVISAEALRPHGTLSIIL